MWKGRGPCGVGVDNCSPMRPQARSGSAAPRVFSTYRASCWKRLILSPANESRKLKCGEGESYYSKPVSKGQEDIPKSSEIKYC